MEWELKQSMQSALEPPSKRVAASATGEDDVTKLRPTSKYQAAPPKTISQHSFRHSEPRAGATALTASALESSVSTTRISQYLGPRGGTTALTASGPKSLRKVIVE